MHCFGLEKEKGDIEDVARYGKGRGLEKGRQGEKGKHILWVEPNLARHPVGAILPKAQRGRYSAHYFVHVLIVNPAAERGNTHR